MPDGLINIYDKRSLTNAVRKVKVVQPFILDKFFTRKKQHSSEKIDVEITESKAKLAQFVNQDEGAKLIGKKTKSVKTITVPRTFEKKVWTAQELADYKALIGNVYASKEERQRAANEMVADEVADLKDRIMNRREEMACQILNTGKISIAQEGIGFELDFGFKTDTLENGGHIVTLAEAYQWDDGASKNIINDVRSVKTAIQRRSGKTVDTCILGEDAAKWFIADTAVKSALDNLNYKVGMIDLNKANEQYGIYIGRFMGIDFFEYNQQYDVDGVTTDLINPKKAIFLPSNADYDLHFGPIYRISESGDLNIITSEFLLEPKVNEEKTFLEWKIEQKSLPAIGDSDIIVSMTVCP
jgi:hypothetical protein